jgi:ATP-dependent DNA ligase
MMRKKPMLAYPVSAKPIDYNKPTFIQPKLDGVRCVIQCELHYLLDNQQMHENTVIPVITAYSRTGKEWKNIDHILEQLKPFFLKYPKVILDGELYNHDLRDNFEKIISLVRKTKPTDEDRLEASRLTQFHCYDIIDETLPFDQRIEFLNEAFSNICPSIYIVDTIKAHWARNNEGWSEEDAQLLHQINLDNGYEGSIVRTNDTYQCKRSHNLRKFKDFQDAEATIVGYEEGKGKREGTLGKFLMQDDDGNQFGCPPGKGYNYQDMRDILKDIHKYMGQRATFTYFERTKANSYRHPLFKAIRDYE